MARLTLPLFTPHRFERSVLDIDPRWLIETNRVGVLLDVDSTLKNHGEAAISDSVIQWLRQLQNLGSRICLVSNGRSSRIGKLASALDVAYVAYAFKPLPFACRRAMRLLGVNCYETVMIGDQIFADVIAGRLSGVLTILVKPTSPHEPWFTRIKRPLERLLLKQMEMNGQFSHKETRFPRMVSHG